MWVLDLKLGTDRVIVIRQQVDTLTVGPFFMTYQNLTGRGC